MENQKDYLVSFGSSIKMLDNGNFGGYLVMFSGPKDPDLYGDYFTPETDFGSAKSLGLYYQHGYDSVIKNTRIGEGTVTTDEKGLWFEAQIQARHDYVEMIKDLAKQGMLGYSSGAVGHLVSRKEMPNGAHEITAWPLGEGSLVTGPAEPRINVMTMKSFTDKLASGKAEPETAQAEAVPDQTAPVVESASLDVETAEKSAPTNTQTEDSKMENPKETPEAKGVDIEALLKAQEERFAAKFSELSTKLDTAEVKGVAEVKAAPSVIVNRTKDNLTNAFAHYVKTGDKSPVSHLMGVNDIGQEVVEIKASNATDMNIGTAADGGNLTTDDMYGGIIRRADELGLSQRAGVRRFTSKGNVLDIPTSSETDGEFVATNEAAEFDLDAPAIGQKTVTKVMYTKKALLSYQFLQDAMAPDLISWIQEEVAIGKAKTDNTLLITEIETNGTEFKVFAGTAAIAVGELEPIQLNNTNAFYVERPESAKWIMAPATKQAINLLGSTSILRYRENPQGAANQLLGHEVLYSNKVDAIGSGNKPVLFGNFSYVAQVEDPTLQFMRDPFSRADFGQVKLLWYYRTAFKVMQAAAVGYGRNTTT
jgi:HK97 family phage major capsid protein